MNSKKTKRLLNKKINISNSLDESSDLLKRVTKEFDDLDIKLNQIRTTSKLYANRIKEAERTVSELNILRKNLLEEERALSPSLVKLKEEKERLEKIVRKGQQSFKSISVKNSNTEYDYRKAILSKIDEKKSDSKNKA